jgi:hypothetical protein
LLKSTRVLPISKSIFNEFEISSYSVNAQLGEFNVGNINTLNTFALSNAFNLSTAGLYANVGQINTLQTSNVVFNTLLGINISTNSISQNLSRILPTGESDGNILFQDNQNNRAIVQQISTVAVTLDKSLKIQTQILELLKQLVNNSNKKDSATKNIGNTSTNAPNQPSTIKANKLPQFFFHSATLLACSKS